MRLTFVKQKNFDLNSVYFNKFNHFFNKILIHNKKRKKNVYKCE